MALPLLHKQNNVKPAHYAGVRVPSEAWCILQGESPCRERSSQPPVSSVASVAERVEFPANKADEAYTENHVGRRENRIS